MLEWEYGGGAGCGDALRDSQLYALEAAILKFLQTHHSLSETLHDGRLARGLVILLTTGCS